MKPLNKAGFTIIEVMLFLAISAMLVMGVLVSVGTQINIQRYRDSVTSLRSFLQEQYSAVANVSNERPVVGTTCGSRPIGQSDCVVLGRYIATNNGKDFTVADVIGDPPMVTPPDPSTDIEAFLQYTIYIEPLTESYQMDWGTWLTSINPPPMASTTAFTVLILRSPYSGAIRTLINSTKSVAINDAGIKADILYAGTNAQNQPAKLCVNSDGLFSGANMAVLIDANSSSASGVETKGDCS